MSECSGNDDPYIVCVGTYSEFTSAVGVYKKKVITSHIGQLVFSALATLMAIYYTYDLDYHSSVKQVLQFLQEKVIQHPLSTKLRPSTTYTNLYRAVNCIEQQNLLEKEQSQEQSPVQQSQDLAADDIIEADDDTQAFFDF